MLRQAARGGQNVQVAEFVAAWNDTMKDKTGGIQSFNTITTGDHFEAINLPSGVEIIGGEVQIEQAGLGPTLYTLDVGVCPDGTIATFAPVFAAGVDLKGVAGAKTPLTFVDSKVFPDLMSNIPNNVVIKCVRSANPATAGKFVIRVMYVNRGKVNETVGN